MSTSTEIAFPPAMPGIELAKNILDRLFRDFDECIRICLWDGSEMHTGRDHPAFSLTFRSAKSFQELVLSRDPLCLAELYFQGLIDIDGDLYHAVRLRHYLTSLKLSLIERAELAAKALRIKPEKTAQNSSYTPKWAKTLAQKLGTRSSRQLNHDAIPAPITRLKVRVWNTRNATSSIIFAASCDSNPASGCSISAAAGAH
jgi:cyclopropane-fatty-acyl-phospholipid synthase